ncbi:unnamed protein product [Ceutorhynchus assimilis]|uniref:Uncharacterized protein n=1 Tax=Ceutorhynchus assimilis TaxID=467358 RepID=A0A9N9MYJ4_9CUCU|nr:unnamed protein product [Ceutorhynchus assimilis]
MKKCAISKENALKDMVQVKKLRFKDLEKNNEQISATYARSKSPSNKNNAQSASFYKKKLAVETINIELPYHFGGDRAVHKIYQNKIKPKTSSTEIRKPVVKNTNSKSVVEPKKETIIINNAKSEISLNKVVKPKTIISQVKKKKPYNDGKIINVLANINKKLEKMQETYLKKPKITYKNVNDCFTQYGDTELIYENPVAVVVPKIQEGISKLPKFEDTVRQIDRHLENIFKLKSSSNDIQRKISKNQTSYEEFVGEGFDEMLEIRQNKMSSEEILKKQRRNKKQKLRTIQRDIEQVEEFYDKLSEITHDECPEIPSLNKPSEKRKSGPPSGIIDFIEEPGLEGSINKSSFLSKEFVQFVEGPIPRQQPMIKIFSENPKLIWKKDKGSKDCSVESVTKMIDALKFTLENSIYDPVT